MMDSQTIEAQECYHQKVFVFSHLPAQQIAANDTQTKQYHIIGICECPEPFVNIIAQRIVGRYCLQGVDKILRHKSLQDACIQHICKNGGSQ